MKKKIIISDRSLNLIENDKNFLNRDAISLFVAASKEEALKLHRNERAHLIIIDLETPGMSAEEFCTLVREDKETRNVSILLLCSHQKPGEMKAGSCRANIILSQPFSPSIFFEKTRQLLNISQRAFFRSTLGIKVKSSHEDRPFICFSENISASGMLVESEKVLNHGDRIVCGFYLPNSTHVVSDAEIVRIIEKKNEYDTRKYGLRFIDLKESLATAIDRFVNGKEEE